MGLRSLLNGREFADIGRLHYSQKTQSLMTFRLSNQFPPTVVNFGTDATDLRKIFECLHVYSVRPFSLGWASQSLPKNYLA